MFHVHTGSRGLALQSHSTLYLAEGAVLLGGLRVYDVENVTIRGFGIIATTFLPGQYTALLLFSGFRMKTVILPRQARDKCTENSKQM